MQTAENKRRDSFLIAEFRGFFENDSHFRTPSAASLPAAPATEFLIGTAAFSQFCATHTKQRIGLLSNRDKFQDVFVFVGSSLTTRHCPLSFSNRQTYGLLEMSVSC